MEKQRWYVNNPWQLLAVTLLVVGAVGALWGWGVGALGADAAADMAWYGALGDTFAALGAVLGGSALVLTAVGLALQREEFKTAIEAFEKQAEAQKDQTALQRDANVLRAIEQGVELRERLEAIDNRGRAKLLDLYASKQMFEDIARESEEIGQLISKVFDHPTLEDCWYAVAAMPDKLLDQIANAISSSAYFGDDALSDWLTVVARVRLRRSVAQGLRTIERILEEAERREERTVARS